MADGRELAAAFVERLERRDWDGLGELLHPGVVYEIAQSRERIRGRDRYIQFNADGWITKVTDFWPEPYEPPAGREHLWSAGDPLRRRGQRRSRAPWTIHWRPASGPWRCGATHKPGHAEA